MYLVSCRVCTLLSPLQALRPGCGAGGLSHASVRTDGASGPVGGSVAGSDAVLADGAADEEAGNGAVAAAATCDLWSSARGSPAGAAGDAAGVDSRRGAALPGTGASREQREMHDCVRATRRASSSRGEHGASGTHPQCACAPPQSGWSRLSRTELPPLQRSARALQCWALRCSRWRDGSLITLLHCVAGSGCGSSWAQAQAGRSFRWLLRAVQARHLPAGCESAGRG